MRRTGKFFCKWFVAMLVATKFPLAMIAQKLSYDIVIPPKFDNAYSFAEGLAAVKQNGKWGYINKMGEMVIPPRFDSAYQFSEGLASIRIDGKDAYIDQTGNIVFQLQVGWAYPFSEGLAQVGQLHHYGYVDKTGNMVIQRQFLAAEVFSEGLAAVKQESEYGYYYGYIDKTGNFVVPPKFNSVRPFSEGLAQVQVGVPYGKCGYIDKTGNMVIQPKFDYADSFSEGMAVIKTNNKYGYIDKTGKIAIPPQFDYADSFSEGLARIKVAKLYGYVDKAGNILIQPQFGDAKIFSEGLAAAQQNGKYGYIDKDGHFVIPPLFDYVDSFSDGMAQFRLADKYGFIKLYHLSSFDNFVQTNLTPLSPMSDYIKTNVERDVNSWQKKGEFESTAQWQERVNENTRKTQITELTAKYQTEYAQVLAKYKEEYKIVCEHYYTLKEKIKKQSFNADNLKLSTYDADNESYMISSDGTFADILLPVPSADAPTFKQNWETIKKTADLHYAPNGDDVILTSVTFTDGAKKYTYDGSTNVKYAITDVDYNFKPIEIALNNNTNIDYSFDPLETVEKNVVQVKPKEIGLQQTQIDHKKLSIGDLSDVDTNIPVSSESNSNTFAVIIGNENYQQVSKVQFAQNDATIFAEYCKKTLGLPKKNILIYEDATFATMLSAVKRIQEIAKAYKGDASVIFYYAGHGIPNEKTGNAFLLPTDANGRQTEVCYSLNRLYSELGGMDARSIIVFMDACFSGSERSNKMLASARGIALKTKAATPEGKMVVFSAASGDETAYPYIEKGHGLFTYFLLKKLQETKGDVHLMELSKYIKDNVTKESIVSNGKSQTPTVTPSPAVANSWQNIKLK